MQNIHRSEIPANQVRALFSDHAMSFDLSPGATLSDLADRLDDLGGWGVGLPTAIFLKFRTSMASGSPNQLKQ